MVSQMHHAPGSKESAHAIGRFYQMPAWTGDCKGDLQNGFLVYWPRAIPCGRNGRSRAGRGDTYNWSPQGHREALCQGWPCRIASNGVYGVNLLSLVAILQHWLLSVVRKPGALLEEQTPSPVSASGRQQEEVGCLVRI